MEKEIVEAQAASEQVSSCRLHPLESLDDEHPDQNRAVLILLAWLVALTWIARRPMFRRLVK